MRPAIFHQEPLAGSPGYPHRLQELLEALRPEEGRVRGDNDADTLLPALSEVLQIVLPRGADQERNPQPRLCKLPL